MSERPEDRSAGASGFRALALAAVTSVALATGVAFAGEPAVGEPVPAFVLPGSDGETHSLADHLGKRGVVLAWFPKAFTPG